MVEGFGAIRVYPKPFINPKPYSGVVGVFAALHCKGSVGVLVIGARLNSCPS